MWTISKKFKHFHCLSEGEGPLAKAVKKQVVEPSKNKHSCGEKTKRHMKSSQEAKGFN